MKVIALNGSPNREGNTFLALQAACRRLEECGIETEILQVGSLPPMMCHACGACGKIGRCAHMSAEALAMTEKIYAADGVLVGSPVYYASMAGGLKGFLDCLFFQAHGRMRHKVGASVAVLRRSGGISTFDEINRYFLISEMLIAPSYYWNVVHGCTPGEVLQDAEGLSILQNLAQNMAWMLQMKAQTAETLPPPAPFRPHHSTNFIR